MRTLTIVMTIVSVSAVLSTAGWYWHHRHQGGTHVGSADDYYSGIDPNAHDDDMLSQLHNLISQHSSISYDDVWTAFTVIDEDVAGCGEGLIRGLYSDKCWHKSEQCGSYKKEGDCYNREHSWPKSWWGGFSKGDGAQTDLFHLVPADGYVNAMRSNLPLGRVGTVRYVSSNGAKVGTCDAPGTTFECFEPPDEWKGDLARGYFYLSTAYRKLWSCCGEDGVDKWDLKSWMEDQLREWHKSVDPVSVKEQTRNQKIYDQFQHNRNPFIDHPEWVDQISDF